MKVKLVLNNRTVRCIQESLGADRVTILEQYDKDSKYIQFEIKTQTDALFLIHAGQDSGMQLALYGVEGRPVEKEEAVA